MNHKKNNLELMIHQLSQKMDAQYRELDVRLDNIEKVMISQEINLKDHMRRSDHLETLVQTIQDNELRPLHKHVAMVEGVFKFIGLMALLVGLVSGLANLFGFV